MGSNGTFKLILGSSSSSRKKILTDMGYDFTLMAAGIEEKDIRRDSPEDLVLALAEAKAAAIMSKLEQDGFRSGSDVPTLLITADIVVVHDGMIREKPVDANEAREFIKSYSGSHTSTVGSVLVTNLKSGVQKGGCDIAEVYFREIPDEVVENMIAKGDVFHVAGGLIVEHPLIAPLVESVVGTVDSIMGLDKRLTESLIRDALMSS